MPDPAATWLFSTVGTAWWLVLPGAGLAGLLAARLSGDELHGQAVRTRRGLVALRATAVVVIVLLLCAPTLTKVTTVSRLPAVAVLIDRSGSMAATDHQMAPGLRLDEAVALGFIDAALRDDGGRRVAGHLSRLDRELPALGAALAAQREAARRGGGEGAAAAAVAAARQARALAARAAGLTGAVAGLAGFAEHLAAEGDLFARLDTALTAGPVQAPALPARARPEVLALEIESMVESCRVLRRRAEQAQTAADAVLVAGAEAGSPVARGLERLGALHRYARARLLVDRHVLPVFAGRAEVEVLPFADELAGGEGGPGGGTDLAAPLAALARAWSGRPLGGVLLVSDGRQTAGADPLAQVAALRARGGRLATIAIGDPGEPRDAVVAELSGAAEVFRDEAIRLDARVRISGYGDRPFDVVLSKDGVDVVRRSVSGTGRWQQERFELPGAAPGVHAFAVRIEARREPSVAGGGIRREVWTGLVGPALRDFISALPTLPAPTASELLPRLESRDDRPHYGARLRGWLVPPLTGDYTFWIASDDQSQLLLAAGGVASTAQPLATVTGWTDSSQWDKYEAQRSPPVALRAGVPCYIEVLHKQGLAGGFVSVGWQLPDSTLERPIPGVRLAPWSGPTPPTLPALPALAELPAEASLANNSAETAVTVADDPLRVLMVDELPRWESRYLAALCERDRLVQVDKRWRATLPAGEAALPATQAGLDAYDAVVIGDLDPATLDAETQVRLERYVGRRGGFLVAVAGTRAMPAAYSLGALADLLPVRAAVVPALLPGPATLVLTAAGQASAITAVLDDPALNQRLWPALPALRWLARGVTAKPAATVLLAASDQARTPVVATMRYGAGRVLWVGSDETWRWRDPLGDRVHQVFWRQALRHGLGPRLRGRDARLQVALERARLEPGDSTELRVRVVRADAAPVVAPRLRLERIGAGDAVLPGGRELDPVAVPEAPGLWTAPIEHLSEGRWRVVVGVPHPAFTGLGEARELVVRPRPGVEGIELGADRANLERLARAGGLRVGDASDAAAVAGELAAGLSPRPEVRQVTYSLWRTWATIVVVATLLAGEWLWRRQRGLP